MQQVETPPLTSPTVLGWMRECIRLLHYSPRTEKVYLFWVRRYLRFHRMRHPAQLGKPEVEQLRLANQIWHADRDNAVPGVELPNALARKYPRASQSWSWFWVFPQAKLSRDPRSGITRRHFLYGQTFQRDFKRAV